MTEEMEEFVNEFESELDEFVEFVQGDETLREFFGPDFLDKVEQFGRDLVEELKEEME